MKHIKKIALFVIIVISFISCEHKQDKKLLPSSIGRFNELMLVANHKVWEGKIGKELKKVIESDVIGLPQPEPQFSIAQIPHQGFNGFLKHNRNILSIEKSDTASFDIEYDVYSKPQIYVHIKGPDQLSIIKLIHKNEEELISLFKNHDLNMVKNRLGKSIHKKKSIQFFNTQDLFLKVPSDFSKVDDVSDFVWFRKRFEHYGYNINGSLNIVAYTIPLDLPFEKIKDSIISIRDATGKKHLPGAVDDSYLMTEKEYIPHVFDAEIDNKTAYKVVGKWEMFRVIEAGPFVSYFVHDKENNRLVVVEGIVYAPIVKKRDFMFELEASIRTLKIE